MTVDDGLNAVTVVDNLSSAPQCISSGWEVWMINGTAFAHRRQDEGWLVMVNNWLTNGQHIDGYIVVDNGR